MFSFRRLQILVRFVRKTEMSASVAQEEPQDLSMKRPNDASDELPNKIIKTDDDNNGVERTSNDRIKRRKVAMMFGYNGTGYLGLQRNRGCKTIEEELFKVMLEGKVITQENFDVPQSMQYQRAARTDKGVSAVQQVVSLRIPIIENIIEKLNEKLPEHIRIFSVIRVTQGFNSKISCDARTYSYTLPSFAFAPLEAVVNEDYRIASDIIHTVNNILMAFKGTHNFHNFTSGRKPHEGSAQRFIMNATCGQPFESDGMEWLTITIKGQSFMLHQIRKMIGITVAITRGFAGMDVISKSWESEKVDIPIAPGLGLMLEEIHYERYNERYGSDGIHETLDWLNVKEQTQKFKAQELLPNIFETEKREKSMMNWLSTLLNHTFDVREKGPPTYRFVKLPIQNNEAENDANDESKVSNSEDSKLEAEVDNNHVVVADSTAPEVSSENSPKS